jgi:hypothetical protein
MSTKTKSREYDKSIFNPDTDCNVDASRTQSQTCLSYAKATLNLALAIFIFYLKNRMTRK